MSSPVPRRPVLRFHGGKFRLGPWIIGHFPPHRIYVEPYGGGGSVLMRKPRSFAEVYNDLDDEVVNVFRVLRDEKKGKQLRAMLELTPWARTEFNESYQPHKDPIERARRTIVRCFMAYGTTSRREKQTGFRAKAYRQNQSGAGDWNNYPREIAGFIERLKGVTIENRPALEIIAQQDSPETLFYLDPPYQLQTRSSMDGRSANGWRAYSHDMTDDDHRALAAALRGIQGMVVLSGYPCTLYDVELYPDWYRVEREALADKGRKRIEVLWLNPAAVANQASTLFASEASG